MRQRILVNLMADESVNAEEFTERFWYMQQMGLVMSPVVV